MVGEIIFGREKDWDPMNLFFLNRVFLAMLLGSESSMRRKELGWLRDLDSREWRSEWDVLGEVQGH